jgi:hypothetical protein
MSSLGNFYQLISKVQMDVAYLRGQWDSKIPTLATQDDIEIAIGTHEREHHARRLRTSDTPPRLYKRTKRNAAIITGSVTGAGAAIWGIVELIRYFMG